MNVTTQLHQQNEEKVLTKAIIRLAQFLELSGKDLSETLGVSEASISRLLQGKKLIHPNSKEGEMALLLLRIYRSLNALVGNHHDKAKLWLHAPNHAFQLNTPLDHMKNISGLVEVAQYLDALRGK
jgi:plasmid maintenance system antidote protein VapI